MHVSSFLPADDVAVIMLSLFSEAEHNALQQELNIRLWKKDAYDSLNRMLACPSLGRRGPTSVKRFIVYSAVKCLLEKQGEVREMLIGQSIFDKPDFCPTLDARVRHIAIEARDKIELYYATEGANDPVRLRIPKNSYISHFLDRRPLIEIADIVDWTARPGREPLCSSLPAELAYQLERVRGLHVKNKSAVGTGSGHYLVRGTLGSRDEILHVNLTLQNLKSGKTVADGSLERSRDDAMRPAAAAMVALSMI